MGESSADLLRSWSDGPLNDPSSTSWTESRPPIAPTTCHRKNGSPCSRHRQLRGARIPSRPERDLDPHEAGPRRHDDGAQEPIRSWSRTGRRPFTAAGNSNGDIEMLTFAHKEGRPSLRLLVHHDDAQREFAYDAGAEKALATAAAGGWTVVSIRDDRITVFPGA
jgi:hypothetical protein